MRLLSLLAAAAVLAGGCVAASSSSDAASSGAASSGAASSGAASSGAAPPVDTTNAPRFGPQAAERALHRAVNRAREERGRAPLIWSDSLRRLARGHSRDMAQRGFFAHTTPGGATPADRARRLGFPLTRPLGENLFRTFRYDGYRDVYHQSGKGPRRHEARTYDWKSKRAFAEQTVEGWLGSPPHRRALLSRTYRRHGLGVAFTEKRIYVTQNLF